MDGLFSIGTGTHPIQQKSFKRPSVVPRSLFKGIFLGFREDISTWDSKLRCHLNQILSARMRKSLCGNSYLPQPFLVSRFSPTKPILVIVQWISPGYSSHIWRALQLLTKLSLFLCVMDPEVAHFWSEDTKHVAFSRSLSSRNSENTVE